MDMPEIEIEKDFSIHNMIEVVAETRIRPFDGRFVEGHGVCGICGKSTLGFKTQAPLFGSGYLVENEEGDKVHASCLENAYLQGEGKYELLKANGFELPGETIERLNTVAAFAMRSIVREKAAIRAAIELHPESVFVQTIMPDNTVTIVRQDLTDIDALERSAEAQEREAERQAKRYR
jgi:hypothetical protein